MEPKGLSLHSQEPATCPYTEPDRSSLCPPPTHPTSGRFILILSSHLCLGLPSGHLPSGFPIKTLYEYVPLLSPIHATCPDHLSLVALITRVMSGEEYRAKSSLLFSLLHSPVTLPLLGPNIFLSTPFSKTLSH